MFKILFFLVSIIVFNGISVFGNEAERDFTSKEIENACTKAFQFKGKSFNKGMELLLWAETSASKKNLVKDKGLVYEYMANFLDYYGKKDSTILVYNNAIKFFQQINDSISLANNYSNLGLVYFNNSEYESASDLFLKSLHIYQLKNHSVAIGRSYLNLGNVFAYINTDKALEYLNKALEIQLKNADTLGLSDTYNTLGTIYFNIEKYKESEVNFLLSLKMKQNLKDEEDIATAYSNLGSLYFTMGKSKDGLYYLNHALSMYQYLQLQDGIAVAYMNIGTLYSQIEKYDSAIHYLHLSLDLCEKYAYRDLKRATFENLAETYYKLGDYKKSHEYLAKHLLIKDSLMNENMANRIQELTSGFESEQQKQKILTQQAIIEKNNAENKQKTFQRNGLLVGIAFLVIFIIYVFRSYRQKRKDNKLLINQKNEIEAKNSILNQQKEEIRAQRDEIEAQLGFSEDQRNLIVHQKQEIVDSINYAQRIQRAILPPSYYVEKCLGEHFILYKPKDVVSGDFYYIERFNQYVIFAAVDCTGHGVPGSMMSVIGYNILNHAIKLNHIIKPSEILSFLDNGVTETLRQAGGESGVSDGMDIAVCALNTETNMIQFAGAYNPIILIKNGELIEIKGDKLPIGENYDGVTDVFKNHEIQLSKGDCIYLYSDGYADQFGGPLAKKFKYKPLKELLLKNSTKEMSHQKDILEFTFNEWKGDLYQVDDVLVMGVRI